VNVLFPCTGFVEELTLLREMLEDLTDEKRIPSIS